MARTFSKKGLRRDLNFSDLNNSSRSLENILDGLVDIAGETFISEDLDPVRDLQTSSMENEDFRKIVGSATRIVEPDGGIEVYRPIIKLKNRFDVAEFTVGDPQFWGGDGLTNRFYEANQINSTAANVNDIFTGSPVETNVFWEHGRYLYDSKINDSLEDIYGGVSYTGYFKPTISGIWTFGVFPTGFFTFEFDDGLGNYQLLARKSQLEYSFTVNAASSGATTLTLQDPLNARFLLEEDILVNNSIAQFSDPEDNPIFITEFNVDSGVITLSSPLDNALSAPTTFTFRYVFGNIPGEIRIRTPNIRAYENYVIRIRFWIPDESFVTRESVREIQFTITEPIQLTGGTYLNYKWLYSENYNINPTPGTLAYGDFKNYFDNRLQGGGGTVGGGTYNDYQSILTLSTLNFSYEPPTSLANATKRTVDLSFDNNADNIPLGITDSIEIGNYLFGAGINANTRVDDISINVAIFIDDRTTSAQSSVPVTFIDHRGLGSFEASATWSSSGSTVSGLSANTTSKIRIGDVVVANGSPTYNRVISKSTNSVTTSKSFTASSGSDINGSVFFYRANGLYNDSLDTYCTNVLSGITTVQSNAGSNTITIDDNPGISAGQVVQFGTRIPEGTTVVSINASGADYVVTLSTNITDDIPSGQLITFAPAGTTESKEICFPPVDTSPPFIATEDGLQTTTNFPSISVEPDSGQGELKFVGLSAKDVTVESVSLTDSYDQTITVTDGLGNQYNILATGT